MKPIMTLLLITMSFQLEQAFASDDDYAGFNFIPPGRGDGGPVPKDIARWIRRHRRNGDYTVDSETNRVYWWSSQTHGIETLPFEVAKTINPAAPEITFASPSPTETGGLMNAPAPSAQVSVAPMGSSAPMSVEPPPESSGPIAAPMSAVPPATERLAPKLVPSPPPICEGSPSVTPKALGQSVGQLTFRKNLTNGYEENNCVVFKVAEDTVLTNSHCINMLTEPINAQCTPRKYRGTDYVDAAVAKCRRAANKVAIDPNRNPAAKHLAENLTVKFFKSGKAVSAACQAVESTSLEGGSDYSVLKCNGLDSSIPNLPISEAPLMKDQKLKLATWDFNDGLNTKARFEDGQVMSSNVDQDEQTPTVGTSIRVKEGNSGSALVNSSGQANCLVFAGDGDHHRDGYYHGSHCTPMSAVMRELAIDNPLVAKQIRSATNSTLLACAAPTAPGGDEVQQAGAEAPAVY